MQNYFYSIQSLRFIAASFVVLSHFGIGAHSYKGIDMLFIISGFVIFLTACEDFGKGMRPAIAFLKRRVVRVFAFYWLLFFTLISFGFYQVNYDFALVKNIFLLPGHKSFLEITWSLSYELYFYGIITFLMVNANLKNAQNALIMLWLVSFVFLLLQYTPYNIQGSSFNFLIGQNIWQILCGSLTAILYLKYPSKISLKLAWGLLVLGILLFFFNSNYYSTTSFLTAGIGSSLILFSIISLEKFNQFSVPRILIRLGDASYVAYLIHIPIIHFFVKTPSLKETNQFLILVGVWVLALVLHEFVERRVVRWANERV